MHLYRLTQTSTRPAAARPASAHEALVRRVGEAESADPDRQPMRPPPAAPIDPDAAEGRRSREAARDAREVAEQLARTGGQALLKSVSANLRYRRLHTEA
jgi:hypothetical protein